MCTNVTQYGHLTLVTHTTHVLYILRRSRRTNLRLVLLVNTGSPLAPRPNPLNVAKLTNVLLSNRARSSHLLSSFDSTCKETLLVNLFMPEQSTTSRPSYIFCQFIDPELAHQGGRCTCFDIKQRLQAAEQPKGDETQTDQ